MPQLADSTQTAIPGRAARGSRGYSLIELMTVITIIGVGIGICVPSYKYITNSNRVSAEINRLLGDMQYARAEAVKEGSFVSVCPGTVTTSGTTVTGSCSTGTPLWHTGWFVFSDLNGNGAFDTGDQILRIQPAFTSTDTLLSSDTSVKVITFNREGFTNSIPTADTASSNASGTNTTYTGLVLKLNTATAIQQWERCLTISFAGIMQTARGGATTSCT